MCRTPTLAKCGAEAQHLQNTSHWGVIGVIGKVLKRKY
jgi:hypothetical protein